MEVLTKSARETKELGQKFANQLAGGEVLALSGDLGSGKTTFVQGLAEGLGIEERVISPTFILMREHKLKTDDRGQKTDEEGRERKAEKLYHIDLYRLEEDVEREFRNLGVEEIWGKDDNIVAIEWAEKVKRLLPKETAWIKFENLGGDKRKIEIK